MALTSEQITAIMRVEKDRAAKKREQQTQPQQPTMSTRTPN